MCLPSFWSPVLVWGPGGREAAGKPFRGHLPHAGTKGSCQGSSEVHT